MSDHVGRSSQKQQSIFLRVLGIGFILSLIFDVGYVIFSGQVLLLGILIPISLVLFISLITSFVVYMLKREWTTTIGCIVLVLAILSYTALFLSGRGLVFAY